MVIERWGPQELSSSPPYRWGETADLRCALSTRFYASQFHEYVPDCAGIVCWQRVLCAECKLGV
jgi:hypothetical protein